MNEYFKGWKKKAGLVTLLIALAFMAVWLRSPLNKDEIEFEFGPWYVTIASNQHGLWFVVSEVPGTYYQPQLLWGRHHTFAVPGRRFPYSNEPFRHMEKWWWTTEHHSEWCGFHRARYDDNRPTAGIRMGFTIIPHWTVVLPLTLLSSWLLLSGTTIRSSQYS